MSRWIRVALPYVTAPSVEVLRTLGGASTTASVLEEQLTTGQRTRLLAAGLGASAAAGVIQAAVAQFAEE